MFFHRDPNSTTTNQGNTNTPFQNSTPPLQTLHKKCAATLLRKDSPQGPSMFFHRDPKLHYNQDTPLQNSNPPLHKKCAATTNSVVNKPSFWPREGVREVRGVDQSVFSAAPSSLGLRNRGRKREEPSSLENYFRMVYTRNPYCHLGYSDPRRLES